MGITVAKLINTIGFKINTEDINKVNSTISKIKDTANKVLGAIGVGISIVAVNGLIEEFGRVNDQIRNSTSELGEQKEIQEKILTAARDTRTTYQQTAMMVSNLVHENSALFGTIDEAIAFNNAATMLFKTAGKTNEDITQLMEAINKSFAKGYIDSETLSQLLERAPEAVEILNQYLGTTSDQLEQLATDGVFTVGQLRDAFVSNAVVITQNFANVQYRVTEAITHIRDKFGYWLADINETTGLTDSIARGMVSGFSKVMGFLNKVKDGVVTTTNKFSGMDRLLRFIALVAGSIYLTLKLPLIISGITTIIAKLKALSAIKVFSFLTKGFKLASIIAGFVALGLIVEDFYHFMKGNDSLLGEMLERAGVDCDSLREKITTTWQNIKDFFVSFGEGFLSIFAEIGAGLSAFWSEYGDEILGFIGGIINAFTTGLTAILGFIPGLEGVGDVMNGLGQVFGYVVAVVLTAIATWKTLNTVMALIQNPIFLIIAAIGWLVDNWDWVKEKAIEIWESIKEFFADTLEAIADFFKSIWEGLKTWLSNLWNQIKTIAANVWNSIKTTISNILNAIKTTVTNVWNSIKTTISNILNNIKTTVTNIWNSIKSTISEVLSSIWSKIVEVWNSIKSWLAETVNAIWQNIKDTFQNIYNSVAEKVTEIKDKIINGIGEAIDWIKSLPSQALQWGKDIIDNLASGIETAISRASEAAKKIATEVWNYLHFTEPEKGPLSNFHTYMPDMIALMAKGILDGRAKVREAMESLTGEMSIIAQAHYAAPATAGYFVSNSSTKTIVMNNTFNQHFTGEKAAQKHSAEAMKTATTDITGLFARALNYT